MDTHIWSVLSIRGAAHFVPPPLMEHFGTLSPEVYRTGLEVFPVGATSEQTCADFHFDPLQSTSVHFEPYSRPFVPPAGSRAGAENRVSVIHD